ncbi:MAG: AgmX/PglI C-terminal domain-containing protein [Myxococcota bacterium]|nr:AgmX/PglI C-terminal domain-containing protein [Myxococcota bacterium]
MGQGDGSGALTESGRTPLAVLLGDTGELQRELDAAMGRLTADAGPVDRYESESPDYTGPIGRLTAKRRGTSRIGPPPARHHSSVIGGRIRSLAEEAYSQELQRNRREEDASGSFVIAPPRPPAVVGPPSLEEAVANLPWELRQYLAPAPAPQTRERPFVFGAAMGALVALVAGGLTLGALAGWPPEGADSLGSIAKVQGALGSVSPAPSSQRQGTGTAVALPQGSTLAGFRVASPPGIAAAGRSGAQGAAGELVAGLGNSPPALGGAQLVGRAQLTTALPVPPPSRTVGAATPVAVEPRRRVPRAAKEAPLAAKEQVQAMSFDEEEGTSPVEAVAGATLEVDTTPPPTPQELDDAFEREFGVAGAPSAGDADGQSRPSVFIPPPVAQLPQTLSQSEVMEVVVTHKKQVADCVSAHAEDSADRRTLVLSWVIAPGGAVENARVDSAGLQGSPLGECVRSAVAGWKFAPHQQPQPVRFPFSY